MNVVELMKCCQLHGINLLANEKYRWVISFCLFMLLWCSGNVVYVTIMRYMDRPTFLCRYERIEAVMEFPSLLLYPEIYYPSYKIDEFISEVKFPPGLSKDYIKTNIQQLAAYYSPDVPFTVQDLKNIVYLLDYNDIDIDSAARRLTMSCEEAILRCRYLENMVNCSSVFNLEITGYGYACVFNGRSLLSEIQKYGIHKVKPKKGVYYSLKIGFKNSLMIVVNQSSEIRDGNVDLSYKWVSISSGQNYVDAPLNGTPVSPGQEMWVRHRLKGFQVTNNAKNLDPIRRGCRLTEEGLKLFPVYHNKYCIMECEMRRVMRQCHCAMLAYPALPNVVRCTPELLDCAKYAAATLNVKKCKCLHTCNVDKEFPTYFSNRLIPGSHSHDSFYDGFDLTKVSVVRLFVLKRKINASERHAVFSETDLFSQLGGAFSLFFGCSILSLLEILQIFRHWFHARKNTGIVSTKLKNNKKPYKNNETKTKKKVKFST